MLDTWTHGDIGATPGFGGSLEKALASIKVSILRRRAQVPCNARMHVSNPKGKKERGCLASVSQNGRAVMRHEIQ